MKHLGPPKAKASETSAGVKYLFPHSALLGYFELGSCSLNKESLHSSSISFCQFPVHPSSVPAPWLCSPEACQYCLSGQLPVSQYYLHHDSHPHISPSSSHFLSLRFPTPPDSSLPILSPHTFLPSHTLSLLLHLLCLQSLGGQGPPSLQEGAWVPSVDTGIGSTGEGALKRMRTPTRMITGGDEASSTVTCVWHPSP